MLASHHKDEETKIVFLQVDQHIQIPTSLLYDVSTLHAVLRCKGINDSINLLYEIHHQRRKDLRTMFHQAHTGFEGSPILFILDLLSIPKGRKLAL